MSSEAKGHSSSKRFWLCGCVLLVGSIVLTTKLSELYRRNYIYPALKLAAPTMEFRDVQVGVESFASLKLMNHGNSPLVIEKVKSGCGCASARLVPSNVVQPGGGVELQVSINLSTDADRTTDVALWTNDPQRPVTVVEIGIYPSKSRPLHVDNVDLGLFRLDDLPIVRSLSGTEGHSNKVRAKYRSSGIEIREGANGENDVVVDRHLRHGEFYSVWSVENNKTRLSQELVVRGNFRGEIFAVPSSIAVIQDNTSSVTKHKVSFHLGSGAKVGEPNWTDFSTAIFGDVKDYVSVSHITENTFVVSVDFENTDKEESTRRDVGDIEFRWKAQGGDEQIIGVPIIVLHKNDKSTQSRRPGSHDPSTP